MIKTAFFEIWQQTRSQRVDQALLLQLRLDVEGHALLEVILVL